MEQLSLLPKSGSAASHAKTCLLREWAKEMDLEDSSLDSFMSLLDCLEKDAPEFLLSKTCMASSTRILDETSESLFRHWPNSGILSDGVLLTANTSESPSHAVESSLLGVIETGEVPEEYFLSPNAATGMLRRTDRMGRNLFPPLRKSLEKLAARDRSTKE